MATVFVTLEVGLYASSLKKKKRYNNLVNSNFSDVILLVYLLSTELIIFLQKCNMETKIQGSQRVR